MVNRRDFLKFSSCGLAAVVVGSAGGWALFGKDSLAFAASTRLDLTLVEADAEMVDGVQVPMWAFSSSLLSVDGVTPLGARTPGPILFATAGDTLRVRVRNEISGGGPHGFAVPGVVDTGPLAFGEETDVSFTAPAPGTYFYLDPFNEPVNRVMGLHGALIVLPSPLGNGTPFDAPTSQVRQLFDDLGTTAHFPGHPWDHDRNGVWVFNTIDPAKNQAAFASVGPLAPAAFLDGYLPSYFTLNGKSGFFGAQHGAAAHSDGHAGSHDAQAHISLHGHIGQPLVLRTLNAGLMWHSPHIHGNHVYHLSSDGMVLENLQMVDTWALPPAGRRELLLPFIAPPDIPGNFWQRTATGLNDELFPLIYPMHDHNEISNTAAGGNYPQGIATHWQVNGPMDPAAGVIHVERAELRLKTGQLILQGRYSGLAGSEMDVHAGEVALPESRIGTVYVAADGRWNFRGRALKALASHRVTVHDPASGVARRGIPLTLR